MRKHWVLTGFKIALFVVVACAVLSFFIMHLWNWLIPALFGGRAITFWQALGLLILCKILFGGFHRGHGRGNHWKQRMKERWEQMSPEEREKFREGMRGCRAHFGPRGNSPAEPQA